MEKELYCPYCGSKKFRHIADAFEPYDRIYECEECQWVFDEEDIKWQELRHEISHRLIDTDEEHPIEFEGNNMPVAGEFNNDACGLSTLELPHIDKIFQIPGDGRIWVHFEGEYDESDPTGLAWHDIEEEQLLDSHDLKEIIISLNNAGNC